jgi:DNA gyrase subunit B
MRENIRKRPGMYIGDTDNGTGLHQMLWEVVSNSIDEHLAGFCQHIEVVIHDDESVEVRDDGRGIPLERAERVLTELHQTGTSDGHTPHAHVGPLGVGIFVVNALSEWLHVEIHHDGGVWTQRFARGEPVTRLERHGSSEDTGTRVRFRADADIFHSIEFSYDRIRQRLSELSALGHGLKIDLCDERRRQAHFHGRNLGDLLPRHTSALARLEVKAPDVDVVVEWNRWGHAPRIQSFVNLQETRGGGSHEEGLLAGLKDALGPECKKGLEAVIHVVLREAQFTNPTKDKLDAPQVRRRVRELVAAEVRAQGFSLPAEK